MQVQIDLPEDIAGRLATQKSDLNRLALEGLVAEAYRLRKLTKGDVSRLLNLSWHKTEEFLKERQGFLVYTEDDLKNDVETLNQLLEK